MNLRAPKNVLAILLGLVLASSASIAQPPPPNTDLIEVTCGGFPTVIGYPGAAVGGAKVTVTDSNGNQNWDTAQGDGRFAIGIAMMDHTECTYLLITQTVGGQTSKAVPIHADPPGVEFGTPTWEAVFARYLQQSRAWDFWADGVRVLVRPRAPLIRSEVRAPNVKTIEGASGAVNGGSWVSIVTPDGLMVNTRGSRDGAFVAVVPSSQGGGPVLVRQQFQGRQSRSTVVY